MEKSVRIPMNLQLFAEPGGDPAGGDPGSGSAGSQQNANNQQGSQPFQFDYDKLASIVAGKQSATEESVLKGYFKQQNLTKEQVEQAITAYKEQQAANTPDVGALQTQAAQAQAAAQQAQIQAAATMAAVEIGIDAKTIPYVLKMADLSQAMGQDGKINEETLKNAVNKVLKDVPALKPQIKGSTGFVQVGAAGGTQQSGAGDDALKSAFGLT